MESPLIKLLGVSRYYKDNAALSELTLEIEAGELFGLIGPDGAGKTTALRILAGLLSFSKGVTEISGIDLRTDYEKIKPRIGYMAQQFSMYAELTVRENLMFFADLYDVPKNVISDRMERLLVFANLTEFKQRRADKLSGGMQKKLALACCLIHEPDILILDEPTTGVDPVSRREFWNILSELHLGGTTIIVSTPYMDEADRCSRVGLLYEGRLIISGSPVDLKQSFQHELVVLLSKDWQKTQKVLEQIDGVLEVQTYGEAFHVFVDDARKRIKVIESELKRSNIDYSDIHSAPPRMEEVFVSLVRGLEK